MYKHILPQTIQRYVYSKKTLDRNINRKLVDTIVTECDNVSNDDVCIPGSVTDLQENFQIRVSIA